jgi:hypothetical protein
LAGEGSVGERGQSPLSNFLPLSNRFTFDIVLSHGFERGIKRVSKILKFSKTNEANARE